MRITKKVIVALTLSLLSAVTLADGKIVVLDPQGAALSTNVAKARFDKLQKNPEFAAAKAKLDGLEADIKTLQASFQKDGMTWNEQKRAESDKKMQSMRNDYQLQANKLRQEQQVVMQEIMEEVAPKMDAVIKKIIDEQKIGTIINANAVIAVKPENNITATVAEMLNKSK